MDAIGQWMTERCDQDADAVIATSELYRDFGVWHRRTHGRDTEISSISFGMDLMNRRGLERGKKKRTVIGVRLRYPQDDPPLPF